MPKNGVVIVLATGEENGWHWFLYNGSHSHRVVVRIPVEESFGNWNLTGIFLIDTLRLQQLSDFDTELMLLPHRGYKTHRFQGLSCVI
jgi:hypothetical protein